MLQAICCYFNPVNYKTRYSNYCNFRNNLNVPLKTIECVFEGQKPAISDAMHIFANRKNVMWQKERLLNILIESLPDNIDKIVWLDVDLIFKNQNWFKETEDLLDDYDIVQPYIDIKRIDQSGKFIDDMMKSSTFMKSEFGVNAGCPGFACSFRRDFMPKGLYDKAILGSGDMVSMMSFLGEQEENEDKIEKAEKECRFVWPKKFHIEQLSDGCANWHNITSRIGSTSGEIWHMFHGGHADRRYHERNDRLYGEYEFDLENDLSMDSNGLWKIEREDVLECIHKYFMRRLEDGYTHIPLL